MRHRVPSHFNWILPTFLIYSEIFTECTQFTNVAAGRGFGAHGVGVGPVSSRCKDIPVLDAAPSVENVCVSVGGVQVQAYCVFAFNFNPLL